LTAELATLRLVDAGSRSDLGVLVGRAKRVDPDGDARLVGHGSVLAVYVSPLHGAGLPTVLGLRTFGLAEPWTGDVVTPLAALSDRLAKQSAAPVLPLPPVQSGSVAWAGVSPPRSGWQPVGETSSAAVAASAAAGIAEVSEGTPAGVGSAAVSRLRGTVWSRPAEWSTAWRVQVPDGAAFVAESLGFLARDADSRVSVHANGSWTRLTTRAGHVLVRRSLLA
jgi:hypothetical protein